MIYKAASIVRIRDVVNASEKDGNILDKQAIHTVDTLMNSRKRPSMSFLQSCHAVTAGSCQFSVLPALGSDRRSVMAVREKFRPVKNRKHFILDIFQRFHYVASVHFMNRGTPS